MHSETFISSSVETEAVAETWIPPALQAAGPSGARRGVSGAPDLLGLPVHHQLAFVGQVEATHVAALVCRIGVPLGFVALGVHDQVAIRLHAQTIDVRPGRVGGPDGLPAVDDKVAVVLPIEQTHRNTVTPVQRWEVQILSSLILIGHLFLKMFTSNNGLWVIMDSTTN